MAFFTNITILLVVACISHQLVLGSCQKGHGRRGRGVDRGQHRDRSGLKLGRQPKSVSARPVKGKVVTRDKSECTWAATGEDLLVLGATCKKEGRRFGCEYVAKPSLCPEYASNVSSYWRQIVRAMKKQRTLCQDSGALIKAGMCRRAPAEAHFRLRKKAQKETVPPPPTPPSPPPATAVKTCQHANKKLAEEYCNHSWSSFCTFFYAMVQDC